MVKVYVEKEGVDAATAVWPGDTAELLRLVDAEFGAGGRLKTNDGDVVGTAFPLEEGATLTWHPPAGGLLAEHGGGPQVDVVVRARFAGRYIGHDVEATSVTVLAPGWLVTHAHGRQEHWCVGDHIQMRNQQREVPATVAYKSPKPDKEGDFGQDYLLLRVEVSMQTPVLDVEVYPFAPYVLVGASARSQEKDPASTRHGNVLSTRLDMGLHLLGDTPPEVGDSGGGCFLLSDGALFAICVGRRGEKCVLLPISIPYAKTRELEGAKSL